MKEGFLTAAERRLKGEKKPFLILYSYALLLYLPLLVLRLTNDIDGLWNQDDYMAGAWELSIGRWFWPWLDRARFGVSLDPLPGVLALAVYTAGFLLILSVLEYRSDTPVSILSGFLFLASTAITCQMSHGYMVITFAVSFFLSVLAVFVCARGLSDGRNPGERECGRKRSRKEVFSVILSGILIAVMMGCYQAGIGTTCLVALLFFMRVLEKGTGNRIRPAAFFALRMLLSILTGAVLYEILLHLHLSAFHVGLSAYQGFSQIGPVYFLTHLGKGVRHAYEEMKYVLFTGIFRFSRLQTHRWFWAAYLVPALPAAAAAVRMVRDGRGRSGAETVPEEGEKAGETALRAVLYIASVLLIPLFAGSFYLLAPEAETHMQMLLPYSLVLPLLLDGWNERNAGKVSACVLLAGSALLIYGGIAMNLTDQYAMYAGRRAVSTLAEDILNGAEALGQDPLNGELEIIGVPSESPLFAVKDAYDLANDYAQYGNWSPDVSFSRVSWKAMYRNYLRTNVTFAEGETEATIAALPEVQALPVFPAPGSIQNLYGVTVVRISE